MAFSLFPPSNRKLVTQRVEVPRLILLRFPRVSTKWPIRRQNCSCHPSEEACAPRSLGIARGVQVNLLVPERTPLGWIQLRTLPVQLWSKGNKLVRSLILYVNLTGVFKWNLHLSHGKTSSTSFLAPWAGDSCAPWWPDGTTGTLVIRAALTIWLLKWSRKMVIVVAYLFKFYSCSFYF